MVRVTNSVLQLNRCAVPVHCSAVYSPRAHMCLSLWLYPPPPPHTHTHHHHHTHIHTHPSHIHTHIHTHTKNVAVKKGDRIAQLILERIYTPEIMEVEDLDATTRGAGGFGSTGTN